MLELFLIGLLTGLYFKHRNARKKPSLDNELRHIIESSERTLRIAEDIRGFLLRVISDERNDVETFNDSQLAEAKRILDQTGPGAFFWMTHIAAQLALLSAAQINNIPTSVDAELGDTATAEDIVKIVVKV